MDKFLKLFGLARRRDLVRAVETSDVYFRQLEKAANDLKVEEWRRKVDANKFRKKESEYLRQIELCLDQYGKVSA